MIQLGLAIGSLIGVLVLGGPMSRSNTNVNPSVGVRSWNSKLLYGGLILALLVSCVSCMREADPFKNNDYSTGEFKILDLASLDENEQRMYIKAWLKSKDIVAEFIKELKRNPASQELTNARHNTVRIARKMAQLWSPLLDIDLKGNLNEEFTEIATEHMLKEEKLVSIIIEAANNATEENKAVTEVYDAVFKDQPEDAQLRIEETAKVLQFTGLVTLLGVNQEMVRSLTLIRLLKHQSLDALSKAQKIIETRKEQIHSLIAEINTSTYEHEKVNGFTLDIENLSNLSDIESKGLQEKAAELTGELKRVHQGLRLIEQLRKNSQQHSKAMVKYLALTRRFTLITKYAAKSKIIHKAKYAAENKIIHNEL